jgi:hypothetical protein
MDNKQDRQLYWEVKQFFQGTPNMVPPPVKTSSLRDVAASVMNENKPFSQAKPPSHSNVFDATGSMLDAMKSLEAKNNPGHIAYTKNGSTNPFNLNEAVGGISVRKGTPLDYAVSAGEAFSPRTPGDFSNQNITTRRAGVESTDRPEMSDEESTIRQNARDSNAKIRTNERGVFQKAADMADTDNQGVVSGAINSVVGGIGRIFGQVDDTSTDTKTLRANNKILGTADGYMNQGRADLINKRTGVGAAPATPAPRAATPGAPAPTSAAPGTAPATPAPSSVAPGTAPATPAPAGTTPPSRVPAKNTPYVRTYTSSEPTSTTSTNAPNDNTYLPNRNENGARVANPRATEDKASDNPEQYEDKDMILNKPTFKVSNPVTMPQFASSNTSMGNRTSGGPSAGQYRGSSNMGMAPGPQRQEKQTLQSAMAQQNQKATSDSLGQMGSVQGTQSASSGGFQGSVLPSTLGSPRTNKTSEFKYSSGSRLS